MDNRVECYLLWNWCYPHGDECLIFVLASGNFWMGSSDRKVKV
jgi:hypothetical protein